jgi:hypothetical protein
MGVSGFCDFPSINKDRAILMPIMAISGSAGHQHSETPKPGTSLLLLPPTPEGERAGKKEGNRENRAEPLVNK